MNTPSPPTGALPAAPNRRKRALVRLAVVFALIGIAVLVWWLVAGRWSVSTDNAYVVGNVVQISPQVSGTVVAVKADDTDLVELGQTLVELDDADARISLMSAEAALAEAVRGVRGLYAGTGQSGAVVSQRVADIERARQELHRAEAEAQRARDDLARREALFRDKFISADALQVNRTAVAATEAARAAAAAALKESESGLVQAKEAKVGADVLVDNTSLDTHPRVASAAARVKEAYLALKRSSVVAPVRGYVARRSVHVGERVTPGSALMSVVPADQFWVDANFKETELAHVRIGQPATLTADLWGTGVEYLGRVAGVGSGTGSAFSVLPAQNASGNWIKIVQRIPVRITLDPLQVKDHPLRVGLSMRVKVGTRDRDGAVLATAVRTDGGYTTPVFAEQAREADARIAQVIAANRASVVTKPAAKAAGAH